MHTKGPWKIEVLQELTDTGERRPASYISSSQGWANSGMASRRTIAIVGHWKDRPNPEDDAALIAAAPELLEALEALLEGRPTEEPPNEMGVAHRNWVLFEKGREVIRKAKSHAGTLKGE